MADAHKMSDFNERSEHRLRGRATHHDERSDETSYWERCRSNHASDVVGLLVSGGLDSSILLEHMLDLGRKVKPLYIQSGLCWQTVEKMALDRYLDDVSVPQLEPLTVLDLPLADVYGDHWSITGRNIPKAGTPDAAVFLPGRNALLTIKTALWCQVHGINELAIATLESNPFQDASTSFFHQLEQIFDAIGPPIRLERPFAERNKQQVMELGRACPLELTFSCIAPRDGVHCGTCNKCAERQDAFRLIDRKDPTQYACATASGPVDR
jgi:7-cyano-7-deazaguanine synthase